MYRDSIGIVGGFGAYATLGFYQRILEEFASGSERDYPHIYMDNDFTMPSRTRALLYGEEYDTVVKMIADSMRKLDRLGADYIVMVCGTAHAFLPDVCRIVPEAGKKVVNIIEVLRKQLAAEKVSKALIIAAEGALKHSIYPQYLKEMECVSPPPDCYSEIRYFIESVKQNKPGMEVYRRFLDFLDAFGCRDVVLGCTEFPVLVSLARQGGLASEMDKYRFWDPLEWTVRELKKRLKQQGM
ncbi:MAG: amino acid racemase [Muribaculaceae bacterium]|nr:amino acid racemase [Muribaculaceae bacterium]